jgi:predicted nucleotidyltransferase
MTERQIENTIQKVIAHHVDLTRAQVFLFGSRATASFMPYSDYDVGIDTGVKLTLATIALIKDELEDYPIPVGVDIIDFSSVTPEFKALALKKIKIWNKPKNASKKS